MLNSTDRKAQEKTEREAQAKARRRAEQASIIEGLRTVLEGDEQMLAFGRGRISGGWRGKLAVGPEAFFAPYVNIGLSERRFVLQHIHPESGRPSEILPHFFPLSDLVALTYVDIETFGNDPAGRLTLRLQDEQHFRLRLSGKENCEDAQAMVEVFKSLVTAHQKTAAPSPTQSVCSACGHILDKLTRFCPYCGQRLTDPTTSAQAAPTAAPEPPPPPTAPTAEFTAPPTPPAPDFSPPAPPTVSEPPTPPSGFDAASESSVTPEPSAPVASATPFAPPAPPEPSAAFAPEIPVESATEGETVAYAPETAPQLVAEEMPEPGPGDFANADALTIEAAEPAEFGSVETESVSPEPGPVFWQPTGASTDATPSPETAQYEQPTSEMPSEALDASEKREPTLEIPAQPLTPHEADAPPADASHPDAGPHDANPPQGDH